MKHCTVIPIKDQKAIYVRGVESGVCGFLHNTAYRVLLLMSEVSKVIVLCIQGPLPLQGEGYLFEPSAL